MEHIIHESYSPAFPYVEPHVGRYALYKQVGTSVGTRKETLGIFTCLAVK